MHMLLPALASAALAQSDAVVSTMATPTSAASSVSGASNRTCQQETLCITATVGASETTYQLDYIGSIPPGWVGLGFGQKMAGSPMVIMWANADGSITLSQRTAGGNVMPTPVASPPRAAKVATSLSKPLADQPTFAFTVPNAMGSALGQQQLIWAASLQAPASASPDATIQFHDAGYGAVVLDVATSSATGGSTAASQTASASSAATSASSSTAAAPASSSSSTSGTTGGKTCVADVMCIAAVVNASTTTYTLTSTTDKTVGWMGLGFGQQMAGSQMVVFYKDPSGGIVLSQRTAPGNVMPTVVPSPPRVATLIASESNIASAQPTYSFSIPSSGSASAQQLIWAAASQDPQSASTSATIQFHDLGYGAVVLEASAPLSADGTASTTSSGSQPLNKWQKFVVVHAVLFAVGFLVMLPIGALIARLLRTSVEGKTWFRAHAVVQGWLTFPIMVVAFAFATSAVEQRGAAHYDDFHKRLGLALFILYLLQVLFGSIVHFVKPRSAAARRPLQNYAHAVVGLVIIGLAYAQVRNGYEHEWSEATGRGKPSNAVNVLWIVWVVALPVLYFGGLSLLPRQFRQERETRAAGTKPETSSRE
ncbi:CBD9-like protein [Auricularia subglabra TFB-10046 SS5]|nr:CBD9-like protein [Auricularia subglabra TFB-10046 SS5]